MATTLLLADDSLTIQRVIELTFADEDVNVVAVSDGDAAIALLDSQPPDIVLADVGMPGKTGYEVASHVKHSPRLAHIPVLLLTGAFEPVDQRKANESGCDGVLAKPFEPQLVIGRVRELLERSRAGTLASAPPAVTAPEAAHAAVAGREPDREPVPAADAPVHSEEVASPSASVGDFFDQLDAAFAKLPGTRQETEGLDVGTHHGEHAASPAAHASPMSDESTDDWDLILPPTPHAGPPLPHESPETHVDRDQPQSSASLDTPVFLQPMPLPDIPSSVPETSRSLPAAPRLVPDALKSLPEPVKPAASSPQLVPPSRQPRGPAPGMPPLSEAFAALLDAELPGGSPADLSAWAPQPVVTDELVERVAQRVLARLSDQAVRAAVTDIVSPIAERLVREEIERIKAAIR